MSIIGDFEAQYGAIPEFDLLIHKNAWNTEREAVAKATMKRRYDFVVVCLAHRNAFLRGEDGLTDSEMTQRAIDLGLKDEQAWLRWSSLRTIRLYAAIDGRADKESHHLRLFQHVPDADRRNERGNKEKVWTFSDAGRRYMRLTLPPPDDGGGVREPRKPSPKAGGAYAFASESPYE